MTWIIAVLLALILVAMMSSNQAAAKGVWKVVRLSIIGTALLIAWGLLIGFSVWYFATYPKGPWEQIVGIGYVIIFPPAVLWYYRKAIADGFKKDKTEASKQFAIFMAFSVAGMVALVIIEELRAAYEYSGWLMVLIPLAFTGSILLWRSVAAGPNGWREDWSGYPDPWEVVQKERESAEDSEEAAWEKNIASWDDLTDEEQTALRQEHFARIAATEVRLDALYKKLNAEKTARTKYGDWSVLNVFWTFLFFAIIGLLGIAWDTAFPYALELKVVKGNPWLAGGVVVVVGIFILLAVVGILDEVGSLLKGISERRIVKQKMSSRVHHKSEDE
jgi:hypothetical protein